MNKFKEVKKLPDWKHRDIFIKGFNAGSKETKKEILELPDRVLKLHWCDKCWVKNTKSDVEEFCNEKKCAEMRFCELLKQKIKETK